MSDAVDGLLVLLGRVTYLTHLLQYYFPDGVEQRLTCRRLLAQEVLLDRQKVVNIELGALNPIQFINRVRVQFICPVRNRIVRYDRIAAEYLLLGHLIDDGREELVLHQFVHLRHLLEALVLV